MMKNNNGNALAQYGIIIILVALALIPIFIFTGKYLFSSFESFYQTIKGNSSSVSNTNISNQSTDTSASKQITDNDVINGSIKAGELGGTNEKPTFKCAGEVCTIDYGEFVLNGVPADFGGLVQSSGTSGGTNALAAILEQIAEQLKEDGDTQGYKQYQKLAELGHFMADIQKSYENSINNCSTDSYNCLPNTSKPELRESLFDTIYDYYHISKNEYNEIYPYLQGVSLTDDEYKNLAMGVTNRIDLARSYASGGANDNARLFNQVVQKIPAFAFVKQYDEIMNNTQYSSELLSITKKLYQNMSDLAFNQSILLQINGNSKNIEVFSNHSYDSITGSINTTNIIRNTDKNMQSDYILHPETSKKTNLSAALVCTSGKNYDNGNECK